MQSVSGDYLVFSDAKTPRDLSPVLDATVFYAMQRLVSLVNKNTTDGGKSAS